MAKKTTKKEDPKPAPASPAAERHPVAYPIHRVPVLINGRPIYDGNNKPIMKACSTGGVLVLLEQVKREPEANHLWCLHCGESVLVNAAERERARQAADAEGWKPPPPRTLPTTPGDLSQETRAQLFGLLQLEREPPRPPGERKDVPEVVRWCSRHKAAEEAADTKGGAARAYGYVEGEGRGALTETGRAMAERIASPEVPDAVRAAPVAADALDKYAAAERERHPKPKTKRAPKPSPPMVCECGDPATSHVSADPANLDSRCRAMGCTCKCYRQAKPEKPAKKSKAVADAA